MTGDVRGARRRWPWIVVTAAILSQYVIYAASLIAAHRGWRSSGIATNGAMAFVLPNLRTLLPWVVVIVMAALTAHRGRPILAMMPAATLLLMPWVLAPPSSIYRFVGPSCCNGFAIDSQTGWLELVAMSLMVLLPVLALRRERETIRNGAWLLSVSLAVFAVAGMIALAGMVSQQGRVDDNGLVYGIAAGLIGLGVGSGVRPWLLAVVPMISLWGVLPGLTANDGWLLAIALIASLATPLARILEEGWISSDPTRHGARGAPADQGLVSTTS